MKTGERWFVGAFGMLLLGAGCAAFVVEAAATGWRWLAGGVLCALGANAIYCAVVGKRPWISRIGPLP